MSRKERVEALKGYIMANYESKGRDELLKTFAYEYGLTLRLVQEYFDILKNVGLFMTLYNKERRTWLIRPKEEE
jgi:hypothetical protein